MRRSMRAILDATDTIRVEQRIAAPPRTVFRYLTDGRLWARWQGETVDLDPRPGGIFRIRMTEGQVVEGLVEAVEPDRRIVVTWGWVGHPRMPVGTTTLELVLVADGDGTLLTLTHSGIPREDLELHVAGWRTFLPRLEIAATGGDPGPNPVGSASAPDPA
jgi:uncharacterized protein YndB with AHSA1/START domain